MIKINLDNKEIKFFIISEETGKIKSSGDENEDTWEDTYVALESLKIGQPPSICFNKANRTRHLKKEPVFVDLNYRILSIENLKDKKII